MTKRSTYSAKRPGPRIAGPLHLLKNAGVSTENRRRSIPLLITTSYRCRDATFVVRTFTSLRLARFSVSVPLLTRVPVIVRRVFEFHLFFRAAGRLRTEIQVGEHFLRDVDVNNRWPARRTLGPSVIRAPGPRRPVSLEYVTLVTL